MNKVLAVLLMGLGIEVSGYAAKNMEIAPGWILPDSSEFINQSCDQVKSPYIVHGDFDGDGKRDTAAIAKGKDGVCLIVILSSKPKHVFVVAKDI
jgi:hypothetical protein